MTVESIEAGHQIDRGKRLATLFGQVRAWHALWQAELKRHSQVEQRYIELCAKECYRITGQEIAQNSQTISRAHEAGVDIGACLEEARQTVDAQPSDVSIPPTA